MERPYVWQMIKEAVENLNNRATYPEIKKYISDKWGEVNNSTINAQCLVLSVNQPSRIHYPENQKPRLTNSNSFYDILFSIGKGQVVKYNPEEHGIWEIYKNDFDALQIRQVISETNDNEEIIAKMTVFQEVQFPKEKWAGRSHSVIELIKFCLVKNPDKRITVGKFLEHEWIVNNYKDL